MKSILQTQIRELSHHESIKRLLFELNLTRGRAIENIGGGDRLFCVMQGVYEPQPGKKPKRIPLDCAIPGGLLKSRIEQIECPTLLLALRELAAIKSYSLEMYSNKSLLTFLNDYYCKRSRPTPLWF